MKSSSLWLARAAWFALPLLTGPVFAAALDPRSRAVQVVASIGLWLVWGVVLAAALVPRTVTLTLLRVVAPAALVAVVAAVLVAGGDASVASRVAALVGVVLVVAVVFAPAVGQAFVDGSSYGDELRVPLRVPAPLMLGPIEVAWIAVACVVAGPLLLAARQWVLGVLLLGGGLAAAWWGVRVLHSLSRRWVVFVPAGMVLHDPLTLVEPILLRRSTVRTLGPAPADTSGLDLTRGALGLALEAQLVGPVSLTLVSNETEAEIVDTDVILFTPTRPGVLLAAARERGIG